MSFDIPDFVLDVIQDYLALGYKITSCLGSEPLQPSYQPCKGMLYIINLLRALHNRRMKCIHCASNLVSKNGRRRGKQCYICRGCGRQFLEVYEALGYQDSIKEHCLTLYVNGMGFRAIERATGVNHNTVINWVKQVGTRLPEAPEISEIPEVTQVDELETFVGKKKQDLAVDGGK